MGQQHAEGDGGSEVELSILHLDAAQVGELSNIDDAVTGDLPAPHLNHEIGTPCEQPGTDPRFVMEGKGFCDTLGATIFHGCLLLQ